MNSFLKDVLLDIQKNTDDISELLFIVPSKRAGLFLKKTLIHLYPDRVFFSPIILSIEEFIIQISGLRQIDHIQTLFEFYEVYLSTHPESDKDSFEDFSSWAQTLIYDFNEIDRYCIDPNSFFSYLSGIQDLNHWYLQKEKTELIQNYIRFWEHLLSYYINFKKRLIDNQMGYQGLLYRQASEKITEYIEKEKRKHILLGFNALNNAEQSIFKELLAAKLADIYWDADEFFFSNSYHEASLFLRNYKNNWAHFKQQPFKWINNNFSKEKEIHLIGVSKNIGQAKTVGKIVSTIPPKEIENTALILADETLLQPVLASLPNTIRSLNITMGLPLKEIPLASFFELLFYLQTHQNEKGLYYKNILEILNSSSTHHILKTTANKLVYKITKENLVFITEEKLSEEITKEEKEIIHLLFSPWSSVANALSNCRRIILLLKNSLDPEKQSLELEYVYHFHLIFNQLTNLQENYHHFTSIKSLHQVYKDLLTSETLDFRGEPFRGLQLMGMLESRCLDFETVIITSVNEGILPAGKSINSFIPYDLKRAYELPTYREKDAIYTYHFYRIIQRAKKVYLLYNTENEGVGGGEKSRFIQQLEIDKRPNHKISKHIVSPKVPAISHTPLVIQKNEKILSKIKEILSHGLSPSAITTYIRNPIDFYYKYILNIKETEVVEETIAANTLGTVIHNTLENFYKPIEGKLLTIDHLQNMIAAIDTEIKKQFNQEYNKLDIRQGKNLLIFEVAKRYVYNFLKAEQNSIKEGNQIQIISIENNLKTQVNIEQLDFPVYIKGKVDRVDRLNEQLRVVDYKTGKVTKSDVVIMDWEPIITDYKYSKVVQVLSYGYMIHKNQSSATDLQAGIISFKSLKEGFLKFGTKETIRGKVQNNIDQEVFDNYLLQLKELILELLDPNTPFIEKEV